MQLETEATHREEEERSKYLLEKHIAVSTLTRLKNHFLVINAHLLGLIRGVHNITRRSMKDNRIFVGNAITSHLLKPSCRAM